MKKILVMAMVAAYLSACNNQGTDETTTVQADSITSMPATDTAGAIMQTPDTSTTVTTTTTTTYTPAEGDATYRNGKLMVWKNNDWVEANGDVTMSDGIVIHKNGEVKREDKVVMLNDGEVVDHSGKFFDKTGSAIGDAWDATKKGVGKAGEAIGKAAKKTKEAVTGKDKDKY